MSIVKSVEELSHGTVDAYERLLLDAIGGDQTLFARSDEIVTSWKFMTRIIDGWQSLEPPLFDYRIGSWGPEASDHLIEKDGRTWRTV
jgi:glucose-6-phosphate 1-dehydrogenase